MPKEKLEIADDLTDEEREFIAEEERKAAETLAKIESGEITREQMAGWDSENWQVKASMPPPPDIE